MLQQQRQEYQVAFCGGVENHGRRSRQALDITTREGSGIVNLTSVPAQNLEALQELNQQPRQNGNCQCRRAPAVGEGRLTADYPDDADSVPPSATSNCKLPTANSRRSRESSPESSPESCLHRSPSGFIEGLLQGVGLSVLTRVGLRFGRGSGHRFSHRSRRCAPRDLGLGTPESGSSGSLQGFIQSCFRARLDSFFLGCSLGGELSYGSCG